MGVKVRLLGSMVGAGVMAFMITEDRSEKGVVTWQEG